LNVVGIGRPSEDLARLLDDPVPRNFPGSMVPSASTPFRYSGPFTETVLLGTLATRFPQTQLEWDAGKMKVTNVADANKFVRREFRKGWEAEGL
jgi:hypothetical protein